MNKTQLTAEQAERQPDYAMYDAILPRFMQFMRKELAANFRKGDRTGQDGWYENNPGTKVWLSELY
jgi:hypothetical protein